MKEVTYEDWQKNPTPRMMWVWDDYKDLKVQRKVIYIVNETFPIVTVASDNTCVEQYRCCEEIEEQRRMTHKELSRWLRENPKREFMYGKDRGFVYCYHTYYEKEASEEVPGDFLIRENDGEWRVPIVEE